MHTYKVLVVPSEVGTYVEDNHWIILYPVIYTYNTAPELVLIGQISYPVHKVLNYTFTYVLNREISI
jgi:hypothetical protein